MADGGHHAVEDSGPGGVGQVPARVPVGYHVGQHPARVVTHLDTVTLRVEKVTEVTPGRQLTQLHTVRHLTRVYQFVK